MQTSLIHRWSGTATSFWTLGQYPCRVRLIAEDDGTWSAIVLNLPGAGSCGATEEEALENVREAVRGLIASYTEDGEIIPLVRNNRRRPSSKRQRNINSRVFFFFF